MPALWVLRYTVRLSHALYLTAFYIEVQHAALLSPIVISRSISHLTIFTAYRFLLVKVYYKQNSCYFANAVQKLSK